MGATRAPKLQMADRLGKPDFGHDFALVEHAGFMGQS